MILLTNTLFVTLLSLRYSFKIRYQSYEKISMIRYYQKRRKCPEGIFSRQNFTTLIAKFYEKRFLFYEKRFSLQFFKLKHK